MFIVLFCKVCVIMVGFVDVEGVGGWWWCWLVCCECVLKLCCLLW